MNSTTIRIYVLWHPGFSAGQVIANDIFDWFRRPDSQGIEVHFRSAASVVRPDGLPPPLPLHLAGLNLLVVLAEPHMVRDRVWRNWLDSVATEDGAEAECRRAGCVGSGEIKTPSFTRIYPVALHPTAYKLPARLRALNFISPKASSGRGTEHIRDVNDGAHGRLLTQLTEAFARFLGEELDELLTTNSDDAALACKSLVPAFSKAAAGPAKVQIFLSHAKRDGAEIAKRLRDYIYSSTQLSAFFDENDIAFGDRFKVVLERAIDKGTDTDAMLVVNSDHYSNRPWCRREIETFSTPRPATNGVWKKPPLLIVEAMQGAHTASAIPEFGNSPIISWRDGDEARYIDTLLREVIFRSYHLHAAGRLRKRLGCRKGVGRIFMNWVPDPLGLADIVRKWNKGKAEENTDVAGRRDGNAAVPQFTPLEVYYPGRGLSSIERSRLEERFFNVKLISFRESEGA